MGTHYTPLHPTPHYTTLHSITPHYTPLHPHYSPPYTPLHPITPHYTPITPPLHPHYTPPYTPLRPSHPPSPITPTHGTPPIPRPPSFRGRPLPPSPENPAENPGASAEAAQVRRSMARALLTQAAPLVAEATQQGLADLSHAPRSENCPQRRGIGTEGTRLTGGGGSLGALPLPHFRPILLGISPVMWGVSVWDATALKLLERWWT